MEQCTLNTNRNKKTRQKSYPGQKSKYYDHKWYSIYTYKWNRPQGIRFEVGPASYFDNRLYISICLGWLSLYLHLPVYSTWDDCETPSYGFYYHANALVLMYGLEKRKFIYMPWNPEWVRTSKMLKSGKWEHETKGNRIDFWKDEWKDKLWSEVHPYTYILKSGEVQSRLATISVEEREWRPRWFKWTKLFARVNKSIAVDFSDEVGERTGSWKGGTVGCGYTMLPGEEPLDTLRRMEKERKF